MIAGRYRLDREVGRGGMGAVWAGTDEVLGRRVALKRVGYAPGENAPDLERAEREARLAARLNHPHVVAVFDLVHEDGAQWLVMEYVDGEDLAALVRRTGPLDPDRAAALVAQAAEALAAAHAGGIVHRDVKPSNLMVTADGEVKLTDFGIARAEQDVALTRTGLVTGSPSYLAPEVASGRTATSASDVWSLGATLFFALEGRPPYDAGENVLATMYQIVHEAPPRPSRPGWLAPVFEATMTRDPVNRWSMRQVRDALAAGPSSVTATRGSEAVAVGPGLAPETTSVLRAATGESGSGARRTAPAAAGRRRRTTWPALLLVAVVLAVLVGWLALRDPEGDAPDAGDAGQTTTSTPTSPPTTTPTASDSEDAEDAEETAAAMEEFVRDYLQTVVSDPAEAWTRLTPAFQKASGGKQRYLDFWSDYTSATVGALVADPEASTVDYEVTYTTKGGGGYTDEVELQLVETDDGFLIDGEPTG